MHCCVSANNHRALCSQALSENGVCARTESSSSRNQTHCWHCIEWLPLWLMQPSVQEPHTHTHTHPLHPSINNTMLSNMGTALFAFPRLSIQLHQLCSLLLSGRTGHFLNGMFLSHLTEVKLEPGRPRRSNESQLGL